MGKLLGLGLLGSAFFSASFVLYQLMSVQGGHWFWSASLRCLFMWLLLSVIVIIKDRFRLTTFLALCQLFLQNWRFWCLAGSIALGTYGLLAFAADYAEGWVIAATYLFTVVASLFVLAFFGQTFNKKVIAYSLIVFIGVVLANVGEGLRHQAVNASGGYSLHSLLVGASVAFVASFFFPFGNQLVWQASQAKTQPATSNFRQNLLSKLPHITSPLLQNALNKVWLMSLGSLPMWAILTLLIRPPTPQVSQVITSFLVAVTAGVLGTSIFLLARSYAKTSQQLAAVDATQGSEIMFALLGGMLLLGTKLPTGLSFLGIGLVIMALVLFSRQGD